MVSERTERAVSQTSTVEKRASRRYRLALPGRITWRDRLGVTHNAPVVTRDVSEFGAFVECVGHAWDIPLYRMVTLQIDAVGTRQLDLPLLRERRLLSLVFRTGRKDRGVTAPTGYALRLLVEPRREAEQRVA